MCKKSTWTSELQEDLNAWLDDKENEVTYSEYNFAMDLPEIIEKVFPNFVKSWTVAELIAAIQDR